MKRSDAIYNWLVAKAKEDMARLYTKDMEVQVNVAIDEGERVEGEFKGKKGVAYTDGLTTWASFRMPRNAMSEPEDNDCEIKFAAEHFEAIGLTGWNFARKTSEWVAFDFDAITGHSEKHLKKLTAEELGNVQRAACELPYVTVRKSTAGKGLHLYVFLDSVPTQNHTEHAALARAILGKISMDTGFDFKSKVDVCGGNMWIWHRKTEGTDGFALIKDGGILDKVPVNWRDHVGVVKGTRHRTGPKAILESLDRDNFEQLVGQTSRTPLDDTHKTLLTWLERKNACWWFDPDCHMLVTHTGWLQEAHKELGLRGVFKTSAACTDMLEQNCFAFPLKNGVWAVRRYGQGTGEHESWTQDGTGWTRCFFNKAPDLETAARANYGAENAKGWFVFPSVSELRSALDSMNVNIGVEDRYLGREAKYKSHDGRILVAIERKDNDQGMIGWIGEKTVWTRIFNVAASQKVQESPQYDDQVRHVVSEGEDAGWYIWSEVWRDEPLSHIQLALKSQGLGPTEVSNVLGNGVLKPWELISVPFATEYPGERKWNRNAAQLRYPPSQHDNLSYPTWNSVLKHCGAGLDSAIKQHGWCRQNGITTGADYLKLWIANVLQFPYDPLPYLFFYSPEQNTGKSTFHEAISELLTQGCVHAHSALTDQRGFNSELHGSVVCVVEELDVRGSKSAADRIKAWVTGRTLPIHPKGGTVYSVPNTTHWIQVANNVNYCPIFPGDTRITVIRVPILESDTPKKLLMTKLQSEAPDFIAELMRLELPKPPDRLNLPVVDTVDKTEAQASTRDELQLFLSENVEPSDGDYITFNDLYEKFRSGNDGMTNSKWSPIRFGREVKILKGRSSRLSNTLIFANVKYKNMPSSKVCARFIVVNDKLTEVEE